MGNSVSSKDESGSPVFNTYELSRNELHREIFNELKRLANPVDLIQLSRNLPFKDGDKLSSRISKDQLFNSLNITKSNEFLWKFVKVLSKWPQFSTFWYDDGDDNDDTISLRELIICLVVLQGGLKELKLKVELPQLVWIAMMLNEEGKSYGGECSNFQKVDTIVDIKGKIQWGLLPIIQSMDGVELIPITKRVFTQMISEILPLFAIDGNNDGLVVSNEEINKIKFKLTIKSIVEGYFTSDENTLLVSLSFETFLRKFQELTPRLFEPLKLLLTPLIQIELMQSEQLAPLKSGKVLTTSLYCQLNTIIPISKTVQALFIGSEDGFSMRALESHIFKYRSPTLMLLRGKVQHGFDKHKSGIFKKFPENELAMNIENSNEKTMVTLALYIKEPWKLSNDKIFGKGTCEVYELQPRIHRNSPVAGGAYFTTNGVGLGIGMESVPKVSKVDVSKSVKFGDIDVGSVIIDNSLEYAHYQRGVNEEMWLKLLEIEVLALGNSEERLAQEGRWAWEKREADRRKYVGDIAESRALLEMAGLVGNGLINGGS